MNTRRVVITGLGALSPIGNDLKTFWKNLISGTSGAGPITKFDASKFKTQFACELKEFDFLDYFDRKDIRKNDPFTLYALISADEAISDSQLALDKTDLDRFGVIWASGNGGIHTFENDVLEFSEGEGTPRFSPFFIPKILIDTPSGAISIKHGLKGVNYCTVSACASSNTAIVDAFNYIKWNKADVMVAGGSEAPITRAGIGGFNALRALSTQNDSPGTASRPFDTGRDGFVMGEGAAALILEEYTHAKQRGATIYAEIVGGGMTADAYHTTATHPEGEGAIRGMRAAIEEAGVDVSAVDYINMHATSTPVGDLSEINAIQRMFGDHLRTISISATKSMTGHLMGAAGAIEAIASVKALQEGIIPPTINTTTPSPEIPEFIDLTLEKSVKKNIEYALSNTFGFGGHNATALFKAYRDE